MNKKKKNKKQRNNLGFSLVEVLLAIVILGLVAAPILQIFVSSAKMNNRSREIMAATDVANLTMEYLSSMKFEDIKPLLTEPTNTTKIPTLSYSSSANAMPTSYGTLADFETEICANYASDAKVVNYNAISGDPCLGVAIRKIKYNNFTFDMIIWFKSNQQSGDQYYTYDVTVEVFLANDVMGVDGDGNPVQTLAHFNEKMITVNGAVANK